MKHIEYSNLLENNYTHPKNKIFASIIGEHPSHGARSPKLWNAAFLSHKIDCQMLPMDVSQTNLKKLLEELDKDINFIGGSVTTPYKELVAGWLTPERMTPEASSIGAVNCLFRNKNGSLCGTNTGSISKHLAHKTFKSATEVFELMSTATHVRLLTGFDV